MPGRISFATMKTHSGRRAELVEAFEEMVSTAKGEEGTLVYTLIEADEDPDTCYMYEQFSDQAAYDAHMQSPALAAFGAKLGELIADGAAQSGSVARSI